MTKLTFEYEPEDGTAEEQEIPEVWAKEGYFWPNWPRIRRMKKYTHMKSPQSMDHLLLCVLGLTILFYFSGF
jgi:hypothetical protein